MQQNKKLQRDTQVKQNNKPGEINQTITAKKYKEIQRSTIFGKTLCVGGT